MIMNVSGKKKTSRRLSEHLNFIKKLVFSELVSAAQMKLVTLTLISAV